MDPECSNQKEKSSWMDFKKQDPHICCLQRHTSDLKAHSYWKWGNGKKVFHENRNQKNSGVVKFVSDKIDFKYELNKRQGHCIMTKGPIQQEYTILNMYAPNIKAPKYIKQILTNVNGQIEQNIRELCPLTLKDRSSIQKIKSKSNEKILNLNFRSNGFMKHIQSIPKISDYTFFSSSHGTFSRIYHMLGHKRSLSKLKNIEFITRIFLATNLWELKSSKRKKKKPAETANSSRLNNVLQNDQSIIEEIKEIIKKYLETNENGNTMIQDLWVSVKAILRGKFIVI